MNRRPADYEPVAQRRALEEALISVENAAIAILEIARMPRLVEPRAATSLGLVVDGLRETGRRIAEVLR